jgi:hypothetical protein
VEWVAGFPWTEWQPSHGLGGRHPWNMHYDAFMVTVHHNTNTCNHEGISMSSGFSGLDTPCGVPPVTIDVSPTHPLLPLAQVVPWHALADMVLPDLKRATAKGTWWLGRKLTRRIPLGAVLLQWLYPLTDRQVA